MKKTDVYIWCLGALLCANTFQSCTGDELKEPENITTPSYSLIGETEKKSQFYSKPESVSFILSQVPLDDKLLAEPCPLTDFGDVIQGYFEDLLNDPYFDFELITYYSELNRKYVTFYEGENYYGENGEYDQLAKKRIRELENFWNLNREIRLNGQHTSFLNDREILTDMIESFDRTIRNRDQAYEKADSLLAINQYSENIPENPFFALDAFTRSNGLLVIGDGLLESLMAIGIDGDIAFSAILSHEWWHQVYFENEDEWNYVDNLPSTSEKNRFLELEADFSAAYFLTHKRGATYNWKRIEDYFRLSFNVGDCLINSNDHHGTPAQRMAAARHGFELAQSAQKKGFILTPNEVHQAFLRSMKQ